jgi:signal transduction histidine kinase
MFEARSKTGSAAHAPASPKTAEAELALTRDELAAQVESLTQLHELSMRLGGIPELQPALEAALETAARAQGAQFGIVWLHDDERGDLMAQASFGFDPGDLVAFARVTPGPGGGASGNAYAQRRRWIIEDTRSDASFEYFRQAADEAGFRAVHSTPIMTRAGELLGALSVHFARPHRPSRRDMQVADVCARHAADSIENHRSRQALVELDRRKDEFLATLAHELRNPLAPLRNGLEVLRLAGSDAGTAERARCMMERQLAQMVRLVDDLLDVSRVSRGKIELRRAQADLAVILRSAIETSEPLLKERGHELIVRFPAQRVIVDADATRLAQVFWNLLNNAARYTEPGGRIELTVEAAGDAAMVRVRDNGIGIPPDMQARVFDIFTQVDRAVERAQGGLGIGLSIAKRLVEMHGGTIAVRSDGHRQGTEFMVSLPARIAVSPLKAPSVGAAPPAGMSVHRILVADDNVDSAATLSLMLEVMGNEVRVAHDGHEAVELAVSFRPDSILMDIGMPEMNGYDACARIRVLPWAKEIFIVALTGWGQDEDLIRAALAGFDRHLVKPVEPRMLERLLQSLPSKDSR